MEAQFFQSTAVHSYLKLDPRTKLFLLLVISTVMISGTISGNALYSRLVFAAVPFILLLTGRKFAAASLYALLFAAACLMEAYWVYSTTGILSILIVMLSGLISRFIPGVVMGYYVLLTTRVSEFVAAMERLRVPQKIIIPLSVMFRFFPTIAEESRSINDAMRMRGVGLRSVGSNLTAPLEYRLVPLLMSVVRIGDELSASALTRGLGGSVKRTNICRIGFGVWDVVLSLAVLAALVYYILA
jgi:energy-coupling factor transporter transmembrane protein EcfT